MTRAARLVVVLLVVALAPLEAAAATAAVREPSRMVVQLADLPTGFTATTRRERPNATVAKETGVKLETLRAWGRVDGFEAAYDRPVDPSAPPRGAAMVSSAVSVYRGASGLRKAFAASVKRIGDAGKPRHVPKTLPGKVGDEARLWETRFSQDGIPIVLYTVVWRSDRALAHVAVAGVAGRLTAADALAIARKQDVRLRAAAKPQGPVLVA